VLGTLGHDRHDVRPGVDQAPADLDRLVGSDSPGDPDDDAATSDHENDFIGRRLASGVTIGAAIRRRVRARPACGWAWAQSALTDSAVWSVS
jgi:hypothetical protein